jgi:hypothetical protein
VTREQMTLGFTQSLSILIVNVLWMSDSFYRSSGDARTTSVDVHCDFCLVKFITALGLYNVRLLLNIGAPVTCFR